MGSGWFYKLKLKPLTRFYKRAGKYLAHLINLLVFNCYEIYFADTILFGHPLQSMVKSQVNIIILPHNSRLYKHVVHENVVGGSSMIGFPLVIGDSEQQESNLGWYTSALTTGLQEVRLYFNHFTI